MGGDMQMGTGVGTVVGVDSGEGSIRGNLDPRDSEAGMALAVAGAAFVLLVVTVGKAGGSIPQRLLVVGQFVLVIAAASAVGQYAARTWALRHPDNRIAAGITVAL